MKKLILALMFFFITEPSLAAQETLVATWDLPSIPPAGTNSHVKCGLEDGEKLEVGNVPATALQGRLEFQVEKSPLKNLKCVVYQKNGTDVSPESEVAIYRFPLDRPGNFGLVRKVAP